MGKFLKMEKKVAQRQHDDFIGFISIFWLNTTKLLNACKIVIKAVGCCQESQEGVNGRGLR
jgi:hypothetical protein